MFDFLFFSDGCEGTEEIGRFPHRPGIIWGRYHHRLFGLRRWAQRRQEALRPLSDVCIHRSRLLSLKKMTLRDIEDFGRNPHEDTEIHTVRRSIRNHEGRHVESPFQKNGDPESRAGDDAVQLCVQCQKAVQFHKRQYERTGKI